MPMGDNLRKRAGRSWSRLEALLALGTGAAAEPLAGIAGLAGLLGGLDRGVQNIDATRAALTYQPRDPRGMQELGQALAPIVEPYERAKNYMGDGVLEATGSPGLATAAYTAPDALAALVGLRTAGMKGPTMQQMAERSAGPGMGQPASQVGAIGAWHGSPHDFDRFDMSAIGTGEGAQAYGHGLYFAGEKDVGIRYRDTLTNFRPDHLESSLIGRGISPETANTYAQFAADTGGAKVSFGKFAEVMNERHANAAIETFRAKIRAELPVLERELSGTKGRLYNVELAPDETDLLDWDAPLSQQPEKVREALRDLAHEVYGGQMDAGQIDSFFKQGGPKGGDFVERLGRYLHFEKGAAPGGKHRAASEALYGLGIPGIRYLDGQSRGAGEGSRNYVIFDDKLVEIKGKE